MTEASRPPSAGAAGRAGAAEAARAAAAAPGRRRLVVLVAVAVAVAVLVFAAATILGGPGRKVDTGIVVAVQATSLSSVEGFSIRTTAGETVDFRVGALENASEFPPGHLAEHKVSLVPVRVTWIERDANRVAVRIEDAR